VGYNGPTLELRLVRHERVDSTSERAFAALAAGEARHGDVHVARGQTAGRGRRGTTWHSAEDEGLYLSVVIQPGGAAPPPEAPSMAGALAVKTALEELGARALELKWPNDLLADGAKLSGVLVESRGFDPERPCFVLGIGVNVGQREFPPELTAERAVTSARLMGLGATPDQVLERLLPQLAARLEQCATDPERLAADYLAASGFLGREVRVADGAAGVEGQLCGLDLGAGVAVRTAGGEVVRVALGHVRSLTPLPQ
jgi:BirA family biotin operon repressor/biotin-[acetyl-CoA-carboxylase] ligase